MPARSRSSALTRTSYSLVSLAEALSRSGSHLEDSYWENLLGKALDKSLATRRGRPVEAALDALLDQRSPGYEILIELAEARSESLSLTQDDAPWDALLISAPILAWTRYQLPAGELTEQQQQELAELFGSAVLAPQARFCLMPELIRFDRLPQSFQETRNWTQALAQQALGQRRDWPELPEAESPDDLMADVFFLVGAVAVPRGQAMFQWQSGQPDSLPTRAAIATRWAEGCARILDATFTGCQMEYLQPEAYYTSTRQADQNIRPLTLKAAVTWLQTAAHIPADELRAAIIGCGEQSIEEYRIGFCTRQKNEVIYGCVWPSLSREESLPDAGDDSQADAWDTIAAVLRECGVKEVRRLPGLQALEFCDDCGTPYFPNMLGEMQHPELPEEIDPEPARFH